MTSKTRLSLVLWVAGFSGAVSFLLIDFEALVALLPVEAVGQAPRITPRIKLLSLVQPALLVTLAVCGGVRLAPTMGLAAPAAEAWAERRPILPALGPQLIPGILGGIAGGIAIVAIAALVAPWLPVGAGARIAAFGQLMPLPTRLLYGGITEEVLVRRGLMTFLAWGMWRRSAKPHARAPAFCFHGAIFVSAAIFGAGHLPVAFLIVPQPTFGLIAFVLLANGVFGVMAGYLYWKRGLEAAIVAHMVTHLVLFTASRLGAYF